MNNVDLLTTARWHFNNRSKLPWRDEVSPAVLALINDKLGFPAPGVAVQDLTPIAPLPSPTCEQLIALCLGHARDGDEGNVGAGGISEERFNRPLITAVKLRLAGRGIRCIEVIHYAGAGYTAAMRWLADQLLLAGATAAIEFHFNAATKRARGHEVLHWERSVRGVTLSRDLYDSIDTAFPDQPGRGLKPRSAADRGALFLSLTHCPAAILEPFFGDNPADWELFSSADGFTRLADAIADGIAAWVSKQEGCEHE